MKMFSIIDHFLYGTFGFSVFFPILVIVLLFG